MKALKFLFFFLLLLGIVESSFSARQQLHPWEVFEQAFMSEANTQNPYVDFLQPGKPARLQVIFSCDSEGNGNKEYTVFGFWDGKNNWKVRFAPPFSGKWSWESQSDDPAMNHIKGKFTCVDWTKDEQDQNRLRHGLIVVNRQTPRVGRYFVHTDGTPFLWVGDTWWNWTKEEITFESFKALVDDRAAKGFTVGQLFFAANGWGTSASLLDRRFDHPDIAHIQKVEKFIRYANKKGIVMWIHPWWSRRDLSKQVGKEKIERWWRYIIHRLGAYNVVWVLMGEYNMFNYGGLGNEFFNELGNLVKAEDPYNRIVSMHNTPPGWGGGDEAPQWSTATLYHNEEWLDYNQSQVGHGKWRNDMIPLVVSDCYAKLPPKPVVVTEPWYEFVEGSAPASDIRFGIWTALLNGAAGHTYGGGTIWRAHLPESPMANAGGWPVEPADVFDTFNYAGARSVAYMSGFMQSLEWWKLEPNAGLISDNPSKYCSADPGHDYLVYLPWGGNVKLDLSVARDKSMYYDWIDLTTGTILSSGQIEVNDNISEFNVPEDYPGTLEYKDWLLHVYGEDVKNYMDDREGIQLFGIHGTSLWRSTDSDDFPDHGWDVQGEMVVVKHDENGKGGGSIITREKYANFDLGFDFRLSEGANSGIKYFVKIYPDGKVLGPEYQLIDDEGNKDIKNDKDGKRKTAALYALFEAHDKVLLPPGQWNKARVLVKGSHVEHWLNGVKVLEYNRGDQSFEKAKSESKFKDVDDFGMLEAGHIMLQDHGDKVAFRKVRLRILP